MSYCALQWPGQPSSNPLPTRAIKPTNASATRVDSPEIAGYRASMSIGDSKQVQSSQNQVHENLIDVVNHHRKTNFRKPIAKHTETAFDQVKTRLKNPGEGFILDSGCGVGLSSIQIAQTHPKHLVLGIDRSAHRLSKIPTEIEIPSNVIFLRADLVDFWRLLVQNQIIPKKHYLLYPNPYPKKRQFKQRWHGHPICPTLMALSPHLELRTNWKIYAEEFSLTLHLFNKPHRLELLSPQIPLTQFERKYHSSGHALWRIMAPT
ncbi:MAG: SAM-dependent methyltransferase [Myxococcota bacterium]|nr:SAM-dependent methyltransferase [Myxococcota bacterium]